MERSETRLRLSDALEGVTPAHIGVRCYTCVAVEQMDEEDRVVFEEALDNRSLTNPMIARALRAAGYDVSRGSLARHRRGECLPLH